MKFDHEEVQCQEMEDWDMVNKYPGERRTCCVCAGHQCAVALLAKTFPLNPKTSNQPWVIPPAKIDKYDALKDELRAAWSIINILHMAQMDQAEVWPRALEWLAKNEKYKP